MFAVGRCTPPTRGLPPTLLRPLPPGLPPSDANRVRCGGCIVRVALGGLAKVFETSTVRVALGAWRWCFPLVWVGARMLTQMIK